MRQSFSENDLKRNGNQSVVMAFNTLVKTKSIRAVFDACDDTVETLLDEKSKDILFQELVRKVFHARINETIKKYKEAHFGRHSKKGDRGTTFGGLKVPGLVFVPDTVPHNARYERSANFQTIMNGHPDPRSNTSDRVLKSNFVPQTHAYNLTNAH